MKAKILRESLGLIIVFLTELQNVSWDFTRVLRTNHENQRLGLISKRVLSSSHNLIKSVSLCLRARRLIRPALISGFSSMKRIGVFILPPGWDASPLQGYPQHYAGTHLYTWVERGTMRVKCLAQEHNTMSPARTRTRTT